MAEGIEKLLSRLVDSIPVLLIILGAAFLLLGLAGGVTYNQWFPILEHEARVAAGLVGIVLLALGVSRIRDDLPKAEEYGIKIYRPSEGEKVGIVDVRGTIGKQPPQGYTLRVFRIYPANSFIDIREARIIDGEWVARECDIGGKAGDKRELGVFLVGPNGEALLEYYAKATDRRKSLLEQLLKARLKANIYLPPIEKRTLDMIECARVQVERKVGGGRRPGSSTTR